MITLPPNPPSQSAFANWARLVALAVNDLARRIGAFGASKTIDADYAAVETDYLILVDAAAGPVTVSLPANRLGKQLVVKRIDADPDNDVTITADGGELIDGSATVSVPAQYMSFTLMGVPGGWAVL